MTNQKVISFPHRYLLPLCDGELWTWSPPKTPGLFKVLTWLDHIGSRLRDEVRLTSDRLQWCEVHLSDMKPVWQMVRAICQINFTSDIFNCKTSFKILVLQTHLTKLFIRIEGNLTDEPHIVYINLTEELHNLYINLKDEPHIVYINLTDCFEKII